MNLFSSLIMLLYLSLNPWSNELLQGLQFITTHPGVLQDILIFSFTGSLGQLFIFYTLQRFGSLSLVTVTVTRKMFSILLSVFWFGHSLNWSQWLVLVILSLYHRLAVGVVFAGIGLEGYYSRIEKLKSVPLKAKVESPILTPPKRQQRSPKKVPVSVNPESPRRRSARLQNTPGA